MTANEHHRQDYLDAVRCFALLLGVVFHASLSFMPIFIGWAVMDISTNSAVPAYVLVSHSFRMPLFFLIAGYFSHMTFVRKGGGSFVASRLLRIGVPFALGWLLLRPLLVSGWVMGAESMRGEADIWGALVAGFASLAELPKGLLVGTHLWFLYYLLMSTAIVLGLRGAVDGTTGFSAGARKAMDVSTGWISRSPLGVSVLALPTAGCLWFMDTWGIDTPDKSLIPHVPALVLYVGFFAFGWLLHREPVLIQSLASLRWSTMALCCLGCAGSLALVSYAMQTAHPQYLWIKGAFALSHGLMTWSLVVLALGLCKKLCSGGSAAVRYLSDASYWLYLVHLPIVIWLQVAVAELPLHWGLKWAMVFCTTVGLSLVLYELLVRSTWVGALLNGKRRSRQWLTFGRSPRTVHGVRE